MDISVLFFGILAEVTGIDRKHYRNISTFEDLKNRIEDDFPEIVHYNYRIEINARILTEEPLLREGDEVICLPPFANTKKMK
jgi:molybdopterin converting factor small subunit